MSFATRSGLRLGLAATGLAGLSLTACAGSPAPRTVERRVLVQLVQPSADAAAVSAAATRHARVPVSHAAAASPAWHALALRCESTDECEAAIERLRAARSIYAAVELEGRRQKNAP